MKNIKVGEYVRTKDGRIRIFKQNIDNNVVELSKPYAIESMTNITKHSKNIIDLIEVGDYVNGDRMDIVERDENGKVYYLQNEELPCINISEVKTILTHEQYEQNSYKVEKEF